MRSPPETSVTRRGAITSLLAIAASAIASSSARALVDPRPFVHPEPRDGITAQHVLAESVLPDDQVVRTAYAAARAHPSIFDGLCCACGCLRGMNHRSLLACYESRQPTGCPTCQDEATFVGTLADAGKSLAEIRAAVDKKWG